MKLLVVDEMVIRFNQAGLVSGAEPPKWSTYLLGKASVLTCTGNEALCYSVDEVNRAQVHTHFVKTFD